MTREQIAATVQQRERKWRLEYESAHFLAHFCDVLGEAFPKAKFILTVREPRSWLRSIIDQCIRNPRSEGAPYTALRDLYFGAPPARYAAPERALAQYSLHTLEGYLAYWSRHNRVVLNAVPLERLLILRTREISDEIEQIASFADIPARTLDRSNTHTNRTYNSCRLLSEIDESYIRDKIDDYCAETMVRIEQETAVSFE